MIGPYSISGRSVNQFVFIFLLLVFAGAFLINRKKAGKIGLAFTFAIWFIFSIKSQYDLYRVVKFDWEGLSGRALNEKHRLLTGGDYYQFLDWCKEKLPGIKEVSLDVPDRISWAPDGFLKMKGPYLLLPIINQPDSENQVVYNAEKPPGEFVEFARFSENAYILKKAK